MSKQFQMKSFVKEIEKDIQKAEKAKLRKAANLFKSRLRAKIKQNGLVDEGNLLKGVSSTTLDHAALVGIGAPGFHALLLEYGTEERFTKGEGKRPAGISSGRIKANPYFLPTMQESLPDIQNILYEEWL